MLCRKEIPKRWLRSQEILIIQGELWARAIKPQERREERGKKGQEGGLVFLFFSFFSPDQQSAVAIYLLSQGPNQNWIQLLSTTKQGLGSIHIKMKLLVL